MFECLENLPALLRHERPCQPSSVTSFPHTHLCRSHIFEPNRSPIAILSYWFDSLNLKILHGMTFNHWQPNLSWNLMNLFTSVGSCRKIKSAISLSKIGSVQFVLDFILRSHFDFSKFKPPFKRIIIGSRRAEETRVDERKKRPSPIWLPGELLVKTGYHQFSR